MNSREMLELENGLVRRLQMLNYLKGSKGGRKKQPPSRYTDSIAFRYLWARNNGASSNASADFDITLLSFVLQVANSYDQEAAKRYLSHFEHAVGVNAPLFRHLIDGTAPQDLSQLRQLDSIDRSIFAVEQPSVDTEQIRRCYERAFGYHKIELPFDKTGMELLVNLVSGKEVKKRPKTNTINGIREFVHTFLERTWPLFSPNVLNIIYVYFRFHSRIAYEDIVVHHRSLKMFGLERLHTRLVVLRAINSDSEAKKFIERNLSWEETGLEQEQISKIKKFFRKEESGIESIENISTLNPIECCMFLSIYVYERQSPEDFLDRLVKACAHDPSLLSVLDWQEFYEHEIKEARDIRSPSLVFLAAALNDDDVRLNFKKITNQYGVGGAGSDLRRYAFLCRSKSYSRTKFLNSFNVLPKSVREKVFWFMISPGMLDRIANIFPSEAQKLGLAPGSNVAMASLETKQACIQYAVNRGLIDRQRGSRMQAEIRRVFRQMKYEKEESKGRLRIRGSDLAQDIKNWFYLHWESFSHDGERAEDPYFDVRREAYAELVSESLTKFLCFLDTSEQQPNRFAFDAILGDKLRHNFISIRLREKIDPILEHYGVSEETSEETRDAIEDEVTDFCKRWITIYHHRSFFAELRESLRQLIFEWAKLSEPQFSDISRQIADRSLEVFGQLLTECKQRWLEEYLPRTEAEIVDIFEHDDDCSQLATDRICGSLDEGFRESAEWMQINEIQYPEHVGLSDLIETEAFQLKQQPNFRREFHIERYKKLTNRKLSLTSQEITIPGEIIELVVSIVDNLISNACRYSGLGVNTPVTFQLEEHKDGVLIKVANSISHENIADVRRNIAKFRRLLKEPADELTLSKTSGTGLSRVRLAGENTLGKNFTMGIHENMDSDRPVEVFCFLPLGETPWEIN